MKKLIWLFLIAICASCAEQEAQQVLPKATGSTYQMMTSYLEPAADKIWGSAGLIITEDGEVDLRPTTEEGWLNVINAATVVAEGGNLLLINGYSANESDWTAYSKGLTLAALKARQAAESQDADALFDAGGEIYNVCRACHNRYIERMD
tara:strand:- start:88 stop:537 length:450 start_codon:yes stop_codon:yes gene_type:complete